MKLKKSKTRKPEYIDINGFKIPLNLDGTVCQNSKTWRILIKLVLDGKLDSSFIEPALKTIKEAEERKKPKRSYAKKNEDPVEKKAYKVSEAQHFSCAYQNLSEVPKELYNMKNLKTLSLAHNDLTSMPSDLILPKLEKIILSGNNFTSLPVEWINNQESLKHIVIFNNPIEKENFDTSEINKIIKYDINFKRIPPPKINSSYISDRKYRDTERYMEREER
ncbi:MAG: leucine-rich repeat domain-containing protein [Rickettsiales bacterium]|jgi:Leucine-rich repeat (LRR) protein|nr:leucine-rich repeat domain-containing protein [Rickettsiales bacterium]